MQIGALRRFADGSNLSRLIGNIQPAEVYNLAAQSHVRVSVTGHFKRDHPGSKLGGQNLLGMLVTEKRQLELRIKDLEDRLFGSASEKLPIEDRQLALIDEVFDHPEPATTEDVVGAFSITAGVAAPGSQGKSPRKGSRWLRSWLFGGSAGKIQQPGWLQKSG